MKTKGRKAAERAEKALKELELSVTTFADKKRIAAIYAGLRALDDEQADVKDAVESLLSEHADDEGNVVRALKELVANWKL